jgi:hypothetical protein
MRTPVVHLNGTSREELLDQVVKAGQALRQAINALHDAEPNARDYYPKGNGYWEGARQEHQDRVNRLQGVLSELMDLSEAIADG